MGQLTALFYKNSLILVRQKSVCVFQVAAPEQFLLPIIGLIVVSVAKNVYQTMYRPDSSHRVLPKILYETLNSSVRLLSEDRAPYAGMHTCKKVAPAEQIIEYSYSKRCNSSVVESFRDVLKHTPARYFSSCNGSPNPEWKKSLSDTSEDQNNRLIRDIFFLNRIKKSDLGTPHLSKQATRLCQMLRSCLKTPTPKASSSTVW